MQDNPTGSMASCGTLNVCTAISLIAKSEPVTKIRQSFAGAGDCRFSASDVRAFAKTGA